MPTDSDPDSDALPIDWDVVRSLTGGDEELLKELIDLFPQESAKHLQEIRTAIELGDGPSLARAAHTLKSSARLFGASALAAHALDMETLGQSSSIGQAKARWPELETETGRVIAALTRGKPER